MHGIIKKARRRDALKSYTAWDAGKSPHCAAM